MRGRVSGAGTPDAQRRQEQGSRAGTPAAGGGGGGFPGPESPGETGGETDCGNGRIYRTEKGEVPEHENRQADL